MNPSPLILKLALKGWLASVPRLSSFQIFILLVLVLLVGTICYALHQLPAILEAAPSAIQAIRATPAAVAVPGAP
jgi:hypothetical protein